MRQQVQRRLVHRTACDGVQRAVVGLAVFLQTALEQYHQRGFAAGWRTEQQQQTAADLGARRRSLEVGADAGEGVVQAEQLASEQVLAGGAAAPAQHVPDVLVGVARQQGGGGREYLV
jgi:hypothetical protein